MPLSLNPTTLLVGGELQSHALPIQYRTVRSLLPTVVEPDLDDMIGVFVSGGPGGLPGIHTLRLLADFSDQGYDFQQCPDLVELGFPRLRALPGSGFLSLWQNPALEILDAPRLTAIGGALFFSENHAIPVLDLPRLASVGDYIEISLNDSLFALALPELQSVAHNFFCHDNPKLHLISVPRLTSVGGDFMCFANAQLTEIEIPSLTTLTGRFYAPGCALNLPTVNAILARLVAIGWAAPGKICNLSGGTSAAPAGDGLLDKATLIAAGATVTTN
jgi:hypothetical protein